MNATDLDGGAFGKITYRLGPGSQGNFKVDPNSGVVSVSEFRDFDVLIQDVYDLKVSKQN